MKGKMKQLIFINLLCYLNNFIYLFVSKDIEITGYYSAWVLSPYIFLFFTAFILEEKYHNDNKQLTKIAYFDFLIRFLGTFSAFAELELSFQVRLALSVVFLIINVLVEVKMLKIKPENVSKDKKYVIKSELI